MPIPHKHAALIKAWADGAKIQVKNTDNLWRDLEPLGWSVERDYRIKPEPKPDCKTIMEANIYNGVSCKYEMVPLSFTFDGETGKLKTVGTIK